MNSKTAETQRTPRPEKVELVTELKSLFEDSQGVVFTEYRGLDVVSMKELRLALQVAGTSYKIYKNTLVRRAIAELDLTDTFADLLKGPVGLAFVEAEADYSAAARALADYKKLNKAFLIKGGYTDGELMDAATYDAFSKLPSKEALLSQLASAFQAPLGGFASLMRSLLQKFAGQLSALHKKMEAEQPTPEPEVVPAEEVKEEETPTEEPEEAKEEEPAEPAPEEPQ